MSKIFYYQPIIKTVADNGSERFGAKAVTKMWSEENPNMKIEVTMAGKTKDEANQKLISFISSGGENEIVQLECNYYLCSKPVVDKFKPFEVSNPFKSGYDYDKEDDHYVAWIHFPEVELYYKEFVEDKKGDLDFYANECVPGQMDVSKISLKSAKSQGFWAEIQRKTGLTLSKNRAMTIRELADREGITPVELINKIAS